MEHEHVLTPSTAQRRRLQPRRLDAPHVLCRVGQVHLAQVLEVVLPYEAGCGVLHCCHIELRRPCTNRHDMLTNVARLSLRVCWERTGKQQTRAGSASAEKHSCWELLQRRDLIRNKQL